MQKYKLGGATIIVLMSLGCASILGLDDYTGAGGTTPANSSMSGAGGSDTTSSSGGCTSGPLGVLGQACCTQGDLACAGHAQKQALLCDSVTFTWKLRELCSGTQLCDTVGPNTGSCQERADICGEKQPGDKFCDGMTSVKCGPDLVTTINTECPHLCLKGECVECAPETKQCNNNIPQTCGVDGTWEGTAECSTNSSCCDASCVNMQTDSANCGGCGNICDAPSLGGGVCDRGRCPSVWANWPMPNPRNAGLPNQANYDTSVFGLALDKVTGLTWQRTVDDILLNWAEANSYCAAQTLATHTNWRLPTRIELISIIDYTQESRTIDTLAFPNAPADIFWTSSTSASSPLTAWAVDFSTGSTSGYAKNAQRRVRCVR